ncbi:MAG: hypothetical protein ACR2PZ_05475 [Pseudomonadales bacterium]
MKTIPKAVLANPQNALALDYHKQLSDQPGMVHPDIEERLGELQQLLKESQLLDLGRHQVVVLKPTSVIVAFALGTAYFINTGTQHQEALAAGMASNNRWSSGEVLDVSVTFGNDWVVGGWHANEARWIQEGNH